MKKPNIRQKLFVQELLKPGTSQAEAYMKVYDQPNRRIASTAASNLIHGKVVGQHIADVLADRYPEAAKECTEALRDFIRDPELHPKDKMKAIELLSKFLGWKAPDQIQKVTAHINVDKYKLPE